MAAQTSNHVSNYELAVLVLNYLEANECTKAAASFKREAKKLFGSAPQTNPAGVKTLAQILNEYVRLKSIDLQREVLQQTNPVVQSLYQVLDYHAGLPPQHHAPPQQQQQASMFHPTQQIEPMQALAEQPVMAAATAGGVQNVDMYMANGQQILASGGGGAAAAMPAHGMVPLADFGDIHAPLPLQDNVAIPAEKPPPQFTSPGRHALRKRAPPKRRKLDTAFNNSGGPSQQQTDPTLPNIASPGSNINSPTNNHTADFLYQTMDPQKLEALLTDAPLQSKFAHGVAQRLTEVMSHRPDGSLEMDNSVPFDDLFDDEEMMKIMANVFMPASQEEAGAQYPPLEGQEAAQQPMEMEAILEEQPQEIAGGDGDGDGEGAAAEEEEEEEEEGGLPPDIEEVVARFKENPEQFDDLIDACIG